MSEPEKKLTCCAAGWMEVYAFVQTDESAVPRLSHLKAMFRVVKCQLWELFFDPDQHHLAA